MQLLADEDAVVFFQAEDGIRDADVTGVQTCALPISQARQLGATARQGARTQDHRFSRNFGYACQDSRRRAAAAPILRGINARSEERRVGKECRSRWSPYH